MKREAVALCRVSSVSQRVEGSSLESQEKHVYDFAESLNIEIDKLWSVDVSSKAGQNIDRKDLMEILDYCKKHRYVKYFVVDKVNRLMREITMFYWFIQELLFIGVRTYFADPQQQDLNRDDQIAQLKMFLAIYESERDNKERAYTTLTRMKDKYLSGYRLTSPLQGYRKSSIPGIFEPDPIRFPLLQSTMRDILNGRFNVYQALEDLNQRGYTTPGGAKLRMDKFRKLLVDDYFAGLITVKRWSEDDKFCGIKGLHKAMITVEEHKTLVDIVNGKKRVFERKKENKNFPLGNIGLCVCGGKLVGFMHSNGKGWKSPKYRCRSCHKQYHATKIHLSLDETLAKVRIDKPRKEGFIECLNEAWREEETFHLEKIKTFELKLSQLENDKIQVARKIALNTDPTLETDLRDVLKETKNQIENIKTIITEAKDVEKDMDAFVRFSMSFIEGKLSRWDELTRAERVKCKQMLFPGEIFVDFAEKVCTPQISPIIWFVSNKKEPDMVSDSHLVELGRIALPSKKRFDNL